MAGMVQSPSLSGSVAERECIDFFYCVSISCVQAKSNAADVYMNVHIDNRIYPIIRLNAPVSFSSMGIPGSQICAGKKQEELLLQRVCEDELKPHFGLGYRT
jgi:predicted carbohydrate-binding protein with CBM5 and CBM33 domain